MVVVVVPLGHWLQQPCRSWAHFEATVGLSGVAGKIIGIVTRRTILFWSTAIFVAGLLALAIPGAAIQPRTLGTPSDLDAARAEILEIQREATTVQEKIDSIDDEAAAVRRALDIAQAEVERTEFKIAGIRERLAAKQRLFKDLEGKAGALAIELYKGGRTAQIEAVLDSPTLADLDTTSEYSQSLSQEINRIMVATGRVSDELAAERRLLAAELEKQREVRDEQRAQAQHLAELRRAQSLRLGKLKQEIADQQSEVDAIEAASARVTSTLSTGTPPVGASASGFAWPLGGAVTSGYGYRWGRMHSGIDIDCVTGAGIRASKSGTVVTATYDSGYGNYLVIDHGGGFATLYAHNSELYVSSGSSVSQGQTISSCGATGAVTGDHLHFEVRVNGSTQDPMNYLP